MKTFDEFVEWLCALDPIERERIERRIWDIRRASVMTRKLRKLASNARP